ncbi:MAG: hypothetical protein AAB619_04165 [Patescibacteria group bacterium]
MTRRLRSNDPLRPDHHWWHRWKLSTQKFAVWLSIGAVLTGFGYVFLTNRTAAQGFAIRGLQRDIARLQADNQKLELKSADLRSLSAVQTTSAQLGLVPADSFQYLPPTAGAVAVR